MSGFPVSHWGGKGVVPLFNGTDNNLRRVGALDGEVNGKLAILFISFKPSALSDVLFEMAGIKVSLATQSGETRINVVIGNGFNMNGFATDVALDVNEWGTLLIEMDMDDWVPSVSNNTVKTFINDNPDNFTIIGATAGEDIPIIATPSRIASDDTDNDYYSGCIEKVWFSVGENLDLDSASNRQKWYNANLTPKDLGRNGEDPTGISPALYMSAQSKKFFTNLGTGGDFLLNGPRLIKCSTNPTNNPPD